MEDFKDTAPDAGEEIKFFEPSFRALYPHMTRANGWFAKFEKAFDICEIGKSFTINPNEVKINTLRSAAHKYGNAKKKIFTVINHPSCYEVYRRE